MKKIAWTVLGAVLLTFPASSQDGGTNVQSGNIAARFPITGVGLGIAGTIDELTIDDPNDIWSGGTILIAGVRVILPRNLLIDLPGNRLTLQQLFDQAPEPAKTFGKSGLATNDYDGGFTTVGTCIANRSALGNYIAGELVIDKDTQELQGQITYINHDEGWFRANGITGDPLTGKMVRLNDPEARHTIQSGPGCTGTPNCSADLRFGGDPDNYTVLFSTGYPAAIPSTVLRPGFTPATSTTDGAGDELAPFSNRPNGVAVTVADSTRFAPVRVGDNIVAVGNFEEFGGVQFLSAHTMIVEDALFTNHFNGISGDPTQPDYLVWDEVEWDAPNYANLRVKCLYIGFITHLGFAEVDCFALHVDPTTGENTESFFMTTRGSPNDVLTGKVGVAPHDAGAFKLNVDVDFIDPPFAGVNAKRAPCPNLINAGILIPDPTGYGPNGMDDGGPDGMGGFLGDDGPIAPDPGAQLVSPCPLGGLTIDENIHLLSPNPRELIGRTARKTADRAGAGPDGIVGTLDDTPGVEFIEVLDLSGNLATWGEYLTPVGFGHPEMGEIDMGALGQPHIFAGAPWLLDRRLGTGGGGGEPGNSVATFPLGTMDGNGNTFALDPFPFSGLDPVNFLDLFAGNAFGMGNLGTALANLSQEPFSFFPFGGTDANPAGSDFLVPGNIVQAPPAFPIPVLPDVGSPAPPAPQVMDIVATFPAGNSVNINDPTADRTVMYEAIPVAPSPGTVGEATGFTWAFGDGDIASGNPVQHLFDSTGSFIASVVATGAGGASAAFMDNESFSVIGTPPFNTPIASFSPNPTSGEAPLVVNFTDLSDIASQGIPNAPITLREWDFGDLGSMGNLQSFMVATNPTHTYALPGTYTVTLTVTGDGPTPGTDTTVRTVVAVAPTPPVATLLASSGGVAPAAGVQQLTVDFTDASSGNITSRTLTFGDGTLTPAMSMGAPAAPLSVQQLYPNAGTFTATLTVSNLGGSSSATQVITVDAFLSEVRLQNRGGNVGRVRTRNTNGLAVSSELDFGDGSPVNTTLPPFQILHQYATAGTFTATLTTMDTFGNVSTSTSTANITP